MPNTFDVDSPDCKNIRNLITDPGLSGKLENIYSAIEILASKYKFDHQQFIDMLNFLNTQKEMLTIPASLLRDRSSGILEIIVKFLKEEKALTYHKIAVILNRNDRTIWATYNNVRKKNPEKLAYSKSEFSVPVSIFKDRKLGTLEAVASYLKEKFGFTYHEIAKLLNRDERNIWTVYNKSKKKRKNDIT
ncbi:MAG: hypothetical protein KAK00_03875 [Nanoarchaeota archaeon]|nr:hypothetical protein [Nanoarchaeota archaeon]